MAFAAFSAAVAFSAKATIEGTPGEESVRGYSLRPPDAAILAIRQPHFARAPLETGTLFDRISSR